MAGFADEIGNHPMLLALLDRLELQGQQLGTAEAAPNQHGDHRVVAQLSKGRRSSGLEKAPPPLLWRQPVPEPNTDSAHALDTSNARRQFRAQEPGICRFIGDAPDRCQPKVDRGRRIRAIVQGESDSGARRCG
jgi:hypothetical protein